MKETNPDIIKHFLEQVGENKRFWCKDGRFFASLEELEAGLKSMKSADFQHHVNNEKNDFSSWIYDVIGDIELSNSIREIKNKNAMTKKIKKHLSEIKKLITP